MRSNKADGLLPRHTPSFVTDPGPLVHTDDLTDLYLRVFSAALEGQDAGQGREGFYVAENGQCVQTPSFPVA